MKRTAEQPDHQKRARLGPSTEEITRIVEERESARRSRDYSRADQLRNDLRAQGVEVFGMPR